MPKSEARNSEKKKRSRSIQMSDKRWVGSRTRRVFRKAEGRRLKAEGSLTGPVCPDCWPQEAQDALLTGEVTIDLSFMAAVATTGYDERHDATLPPQHSALIGIDLPGDLSVMWL